MPRPTVLLSKIGSGLVPAAAAASLLVASGCGEDSERSAAVCTPGGPGSVDPSSCDPDPLRTGLPPLWNGNSVDVDDCPILELTAKYDEPDAMIFKAMIKVESNFQFDAVGCTQNGPCCPEVGWTASECACLGVMQTGPECGATSGLGLLSSGHPNMEKDPNCSDFTNSVFNPVVAIELGISAVSRIRQRMQQDFPGCSEDQYTMMAIGDYNHYHSTESCTVFNFDYDSAVLEAYDEYAAAAGWPAHAYVAQ